MLQLWLIEMEERGAEIEEGNGMTGTVARTEHVIIGTDRVAVVERGIVQEIETMIPTIERENMGETGIVTGIVTGIEADTATECGSEVSGHFFC